MFCPQCGVQQPDASPQCIGCGAQLRTPARATPPSSPPSGSGMTALRIAVFAVLFGILGYALAQFFPLFSDPLTKNICQPFSPCRDSAVPGYVVGGVILGMLFGLLNDILVKQSAARKS